MAAPSNPGEDKAWQLLASMKPENVCRAAHVSFNAGSRTYRIRSLGMDFAVSLPDRTISSTATGSEVMLTRLSYFFRLSVLWYLVTARDTPCTGTLVKLQTIPGGDIFTRGSHTLPLDALAAKYGKNREAFIHRAKAFGGEAEKRGDASLRLYPLPKIPVVLTLWLEDEEFPAQADLLFDSCCQQQLPIDIIWSVGMLSVLAMMQG